jgi:TonB family protein
MARANVRLARSMIICILALTAVPSASAQQTAMEAAADRLVGPIDHSKQRAVAVFDFSGPGDRVTVLGEKLADDLSAAITKSSQRIQVEDRSRIEAKRKENSYAPEIVRDPPSVLLFAQELRAKVMIIGELSPSSSNLLNVDLKAYRADNGKGITGLQVSIPITEEILALMAKNVSPYDVPAAFSTYPKSDAGGYSAPTCIYCPKPEYSPEALAKRVQGVVELIAIVGGDGRITSVSVLKGLPGGLTARAIDDVKKWKLAPAKGPDGKPATVRQIIELTFQLY